MKTNNSIFKRVLAMVLCVLMCAGVLTACFQMPEFNPGVGVITNNGLGDTTLPSTGDKVENEPNEDPVDPVDPEPVDPNLIFSASTTIDSSDLLLGSLTNDVVISGEGATALVPSDVKVETGASSIALTLKNVEENEVDFGDAELLNNLDVHISGIALDNTTPMTVMLGAILPIGLANTELKLYHIENGEAVLMTRVNSAADFAIHNQYVYDAETGNVTIYVASFSVFAMVKATADVWDGTSDYSWYNANNTEFTLTSAEQFAGFRDIVDGTAVINDATVQDSFKGKTVKLGVDIDLNNINFDPIGYGYTYNKDSNTAFMGTFDGQGHTIYNLYEQGWDLESATGKDYTYSTAGAGLFASIENATIKNLAVSGADIKMECVDMGIVVGYAQGTCHFENIVVTNSKIANYQRATGGVVGEVCYGPYGVEHNNENYSHTFKNIVVDSSVTVGSLWGDFDNLSGGVIGGKWGDATVLMEDVTVAVRLDVYSDVTAAYQWYAYRRCGMLIGHTEQNSPKSALNAAAPFLTCENVNVYYGDWVNYTYYQFANQDSGTGRRYPWVRAEEGLNNGAFSNPRYGVPTHNGVKVTEDPNMETLKTDYTPIVFNQLYGGGQGVYGCAEHDGVTTNSKNGKIIYVHNNAGWTNLKLQYWFANGNDTWTTIIDGIDMSTMLVEGNTYKIQLPSGAYAFKIVADQGASDEFILANYENNGNVTLGDTSCTHTSTTIVEENVVNATCAANGSYDKVTKCAECGEEISRETITTDKLAHTAGTAVVENNVASSCTETGSYDNVVYCTVCNAEISRETITVDAKGHTPGDAATCTTAQTCTVCSAVIKEALGHDMVIDEAVAPTCTTTGLTEGSHCSRCDYVVAQEVLDKVAHTPADAVVENRVESSCTVAGSYENVVYCSVCKTHEISREKVTLELAAHTEVVDEAVAATCTTAGKTEGSHCSVCNTVLVAQKTVAALGHTWNISTHKCSVCGVSAPTKTIYFKNEWVWSDVRIYYWYTTSSGTVNNTMPGTKMTKVDNDGTYDYYTYEVPEYLTGFIILDASQMDKNGYVPDDKKTPDILLKDIEDNEMFYMFHNGSATKQYQVKSEDYASYKTQFKVIYLDLSVSNGTEWRNDSAWFAAYVWGSGDAWYAMSDIDGDKIYSCWIPTKYTNVIFCRMNPNKDIKSGWDGRWNQTIDLTIGSNNCYKITNAWNGTNGKAQGSWYKK